MNINNGTLWSSRWNDNSSADKNQHVEVMYSQNVAPTPFQGMAIK